MISIRSFFYKHSVRLVPETEGVYEDMPVRPRTLFESSRDVFERVFRLATYIAVGLRENVVHVSKTPVYLNFVDTLYINDIRRNRANS